MLTSPHAGEPTPLSDRNRRLEELDELAKLVFAAENFAAKVDTQAHIQLMQVRARVKSIIQEVSSS